MSLPAANSASTAGARGGQGLGPDDPLGDGPTERPPALHEVLDLFRLGARVVVRGVLELGVRDGQLDAVAEHAQLVLGQLLGLVGDVASLDARAQRPALDRLGQDDRRGAAVLGRGLVGGVELAVVVPAAAELGQVVVGQLLDELAQARVRPEEVLPDVRPAGHAELLELAVQGVVHLLDEHAVDVPGQELVPLARPDDLDDVPAGAAEDRLELLDDLAVAADRSVEALQVAVDDEGQVVEAFARRHMERAERLRLVGLAVAQERPHARAARVEQATVLQVAVEPGLVDGRDGPEAHRHRRVLPEVGHQARMRVGAQAGLARDRLPAEVVELVLAQAAFEERPRVDARSRMALVEDLVAGRVTILAPEEVVEPDLVQAGRARVRRQVAADARELRVGPEDHRHRIPADDPPDAQLHRLVTREVGLLLGADRVDVAGLGQRRQPDLELSGSLEELVDEEPGASLALLLHDLVEGLHPFVRLGRIDVGQLVLELVEIHAGTLRDRAVGRMRQSLAHPPADGSRHKVASRMRCAEARGCRAAPPSRARLRT